MKESLSKLDKKLIFRETFQDEATVRANGGVPTNVVFEKGVAKFPTPPSTSSKILNQIKKSVPISVRLRFKCVPTGAIQVLFDTRSPVGGQNGFSLYLETNNKLNNFLGGTTYINAVETLNNTHLILPDRVYEVVITSLAINTASYLTIGENYALLFPTNATYELFEIYEGTLTAEEVKNLYQNKRYKQLQPHGEILGPELITNVADREFTSDTGYWTKSPNWVISNGTINSNGGLGNITRVVLTTGKLYVVKLEVKNYISGQLNIGDAAGYWAGGTITANGSYSYLRYAANPTFMIYGSTSAPNLSIDNISIREVLSNITPILDVDAFDGVIKNRRSGGLLSELIINQADREFSSNTGFWTISGETTISNGIARIYSSAGVNSGISKSFLTVGKLYRLTFNILANRGVGNIQCSGLGYNSIIPTVGKLTLEGVAVNAIVGISRSSGTFTDVDIDNISIQEVIPSVIPTAISVVKDGGVNVMRFNGSTSGIDCGSYHNLLGDITINCWLKPSSLLSVPGIIENTKIILLTLGSSYFRFYSDGANFAASAVGSITLGKYQNVIITRNSSGITNFYINGILSGVANQSSGTPVAGTTNIVIGRQGGNYFGPGFVPRLQIFQGIMTPQEISQKFTSERNKYNV